MATCRLPSSPQTLLVCSRPQTYSRVTKILEAMGGTAKDFYETRNEWFERYDTLANDGKTHVVAEVMLDTELPASA